MITEPGTVARVDGQFAWVRCEAQEGCRRCAEGRGCGGGLLGRLLGDRLRLVRATLDSQDLRVGEGVVIGLGETALVKAALVMYLVPVIMLLLGAAAMHRLAGGAEPWVIAGGAAGFAAGLALARRFGRRRRADPRYQPVILGRLDAGADEGCPVSTRGAP